MNFFVAGLPRSRTAWLSNFLTYDGHYCFHEGVNGCRTIKEYKNKLDGSGDSCTGLTLLNIPKHFPKSPIVIIDSPPERATEFTKNNYGNSDYIYVIKKQLDKMAGLHIDFNDIDDRLEDIWNYLIGTHYDRIRGELMLGLNIKAISPYPFDLEAARQLILNTRG